jgi:hypothetical protein
MYMVEAGVGGTALPQLGCPPAGHRVLAVRPLIDPVVDREVGLVRAAAATPGAALLALQDIVVRCMQGSAPPGLSPLEPPPAGGGRPVTPP